MFLFPARIELIKCVSYHDNFVSLSSRSSWFGSTKLRFLHDIHSQVKTREAIDFLLESEVMPLCLHSIEVGRELSKTVSFSIRYSYRFLLLCHFLVSLGCKIWNPLIYSNSKLIYYKDFYRQMLVSLFWEGKCLKFQQFATVIFSNSPLTKTFMSNPSH
jgi:hypothetical protein